MSASVRGSGAHRLLALSSANHEVILFSFSSHFSSQFSHHKTKHQTSHIAFNLSSSIIPQHEGRRSPHPPCPQPRPLRPLPAVQQLQPVSDLHRGLLPAEQPEHQLQWARRRIRRIWRRFWRIWWRIRKIACLIKRVHRFLSI